MWARAKEQKEKKHSQSAVHSTHPCHFTKQHSKVEERFPELLVLTELLERLGHDD
jgi:hypothetical protein